MLRFVCVALPMLFLLSCSGGTSLDQATQALEDTRCTGESADKSRAIVEWKDGSTTFESISDVEDFKTSYVKPRLDEIKSVYYNQKIKLRSDDFKSYEASSTATETLNWGQKTIQLLEANQTITQKSFGEGITVAVVDSYVDVTHKQLQAQILVNTNEIPNNGIDDDNNGLVDDYLGYNFASIPTQKNVLPSPHGTHVSGIIAANSSFGPVKGIAPGAKILPSQFLNDGGEGTLEDAIKALNYAVQRGAKVINASWGGSPCGGALTNTFQMLEQKGVLIVVAAGNEYQDIDITPTYPASFNVRTQITVAASDWRDYMPGWSNSGFKTVHLAAPGSSIISTTPGNSYQGMDGTSMAAPFVTGAAAALWSQFPQATASQIKNALLQGVEQPSGSQFRVVTHGRLNLLQSLQHLKQNL